MSEEFKSCPFCQGKCSETFGDDDLCADCELGCVRSERDQLREGLRIVANSAKNILRVVEDELARSQGVERSQEEEVK